MFVFTDSHKKFTFYVVVKEVFLSALKQDTPLQPYGDQNDEEMKRRMKYISTKFLDIMNMID